jgi:hypothetical protein
MDIKERHKDPAVDAHAISYQHPVPRTDYNCTHFNISSKKVHREVWGVQHLSDRCRR